MSRVAYFATGAVTSFTEIAERSLFKKMGFSIDEIMTLSVVINLSWGFRILFGKASDAFSRRLSRENQFELVSIVSAAIWIATAASASAGWIWTTVFLLFVGEIGAATSTTIADSSVVEIAIKKRGNPSAECSRWRIFGRVLACYFGNVLLTTTDDEVVVFCVQAASYATFAIVHATSYRLGRRGKYFSTISSADEEEEEEKEIEKKESASSSSATEIYAAVIFFSIVCVVPTTSTATFYYFTGPLGFSYADFGKLDAVYGLSSVAATYAVGNLAGVRKDLVRFVYSVFQCVLQIFPALIVSRTTFLLGWSDFEVAAISGSTAVFVDRLVWTDVVATFAESAPKGEEATFFAKVTTIPDVAAFFGYVASLAMNAWYGVDHDDFGNLLKLYRTCSFAFLITLPAAVFSERIVAFFVVAGPKEGEETSRNGSPEESTRSS